MPSSSWVRMNEWSFLCKWWEPILESVSEFERKYYDGWFQDDGIQVGRIQDGCHHQIRWRGMSLSQIELVWGRVRVEWECFYVNLREDNKVSESKMAVAESSMLELKMAAIIKLSQEWMSEVYSVQIGWILDGRIQDGCHHQVELEWMSLSQIELVRVKVLCKMAESKITEFKMAELEMAVINKLSQNEWVKFFCANGGEGNVSKFFCANGGNQSWQVHEWIWEE